MVPAIMTIINNKSILFKEEIFLASNMSSRIYLMKYAGTSETNEVSNTKRNKMTSKVKCFLL